MGAHADVATPTTTRSLACAASVSIFGADVVALPPDRHDALVAVVSHVPHLTAVTLMGLADVTRRGARCAAASRRRWLPRHDPHRVGSSGDLARHLRARTATPSSTSSTSLIAGWPACAALVEGDDRDGLLDGADRGSRGPRQPADARRCGRPTWSRCACRSPIARAWRPRSFTLAAELGVNIFDFEIAHSAEGNRACIIAVVDVTKADRFRDGLTGRGFHPRSTRSND